MASALMMILAVLIMPVPTMVLDFLLVVSICLGVMILVLTIQLKEPLDLSSFPSILLVLTLFRLSLNVATTRQILLSGYAGTVIQAFGDFVVGGNFVVGAVVFIILLVINFKVITSGSSRIAEVAARFTLDAMPGKQMSIDADLNQGLIDDKTALERRERLGREADFFGAMDGASKFVRGDAVAGLIVTVVNIAGGFTIGMIQQNMSAGEAIKTYSILTIGDGLVAQIPALIISTAAGMMVTRAASEENLGGEINTQVFSHPKPLMITGSISAIIGLVPGLPFIPFVTLGVALIGMGFVMRNRVAKLQTAEAASAVGGKQIGKGKGNELPETGKAPAALPPASVAGFKQVLNVSPMDLEIGFGLVPLVDKEQGGKLVDRIGMVRAQIAEELGIVIPPVNVRDNVNLKNLEYSIKIRGLEVARDTVRPGYILAINPGPETRLDGGIPVREPAFGFQAFWLPENRRDLAESKGLTVVDCASVITTHLAEIVKRNASDIITRQSVKELIDQLKETNQAAVDELIPNVMNIGGIHRVLQILLRERVSIRDLSLILETLADHAGKTQDMNLLAEFCRKALSGHICKEYLMPDGTLNAIGVAPQLEDIIRKHVHREANELGTLNLDPAQAHKILESIGAALEKAHKEDVQPVLLCSPMIRAHLRQLTFHDFRDLAVISFAEVPDEVKVNMVSVVSLPETAG